MSSEQSDPSNNDDSSGTKLPFLIRCIATGFLSGYSPWASGTVGSVVGAMFFLIPGFVHPFVLASAIIAALFLGVYASKLVAQVEGNRLTKSAQRAKDRFQPDSHHGPDPSIVVIDEIVGMWIAMFAIPLSLTSVVVAFVLFRVFDIVKPYPAKQVEQYQNGWGIMLDDVVAGIYANIATRVIIAILVAFLPNIVIYQ
jgi:phosphatidylglycerophosphatase A